MSEAALYAGRVSHARPGRHRLSYKLFMLSLDLDALTALDRRLRFFSHNRFNLAAVFDRDHAGRKNLPIRPQIDAMLRQAGIGWDDGRIVLLSMPRILNYVFNPLSIYFCYRRNGEIAALVHEVRNTFGESHSYILPAACDSSGAVTQTCAKDFFVSPFLDMNLRYEFRISPPGERVSVAMIVRRGDSVALTASFSGKRRALTDAALLRAWIANPLMTLTVIVGIHWEALKMLLKGIPYLGRTRGAPL